MIDEKEVASLAIKYGAPVRWRHAQDWSRPLASGGDEQWWLSVPNGRRGEIVLVMPHSRDHVLVHTKHFYPAGTFRLMTGGVEYDERVEDAARREIYEETGAPVALEKFLGIVEYEFSFQHEHSQFVSYIFQTSEMHQPPRVMDESEEIAEFREVGWDALKSIAQNLERMQEDWSDWGRYRAPAHRLVHQLRFAQVKQ